MKDKNYTGDDLNRSWEIGYKTGEEDGRIRAMRKCIEFLEKEIEQLKKTK